MAVLIPNIAFAQKKWFVCDISFMSQFRDSSFAYKELHEYVKFYGANLIGIMVNNDEYIGNKRAGVCGHLGGKDLVAWLANIGEDLESAVEVLRCHQTDHLKVMSSKDTLLADVFAVNLLVINRAPELKTKEVDCQVVA